MKIYEHRLAMYDYARGNSVKQEYLFSLLETVRRLGLTGLAVYFEDLSMFVQPRLFRGSITLAGWRRLDAEARRQGLMLLPLLNLYGHCKQTLAHACYAGLRDDPAASTLNYSLPATKTLVCQCLDAVTETFHAPFIHIGFDEIWGLGHSHEIKTGRPADIAATYSRNLTWAGAEVVRRGRRPMFWADMASVYYPEIIPDLPRELVPVDWFYREEPEYPSLRRWTKAGFDLWVAPTIGFSDRAWPDNEAWLPHAKKLLQAGREASASGVIFTAWEQPAALFSARLPLLAWETRTASQLKTPSLQRVTTQWYKPTLGNIGARSFARTSIALGSIRRFLPAEAQMKFRDLPALRQSWYQHDPSARSSHRIIRRILHRVSSAAASHPDLALAHARYSFWADLLDPEQIDPSRLAREALRLEPLIKQTWLRERTVGQYNREFKPALEQLVRRLKRWPKDLCGPAPQYAPAIIHAARNRPPAVPTVHGFIEQFPWQEQARLESEPTSVFIWHTENALHFRFECAQQRKPRGVETSVDFLLVRDDSISLCLDFHGNGEGYLWIEANPAGTTFCQWHNQNNENSEWHPLAGRKDWGRSKHHPAGWSVELCISYADLKIKPPAKGSVLGLTMTRHRSWGHAPQSRWGGMGWLARDNPRCLSRLVLL